MKQVVATNERVYLAVARCFQALAQELVPAAVRVLLGVLMADWW